MKKKLLDMPVHVASLDDIGEKRKVRRRRDRETFDHAIQTTPDRATPR